MREDDNLGIDPLGQAAERIPSYDFPGVLRIADTEDRYSNGPGSRFRFLRGGLRSYGAGYAL